MKDEQRRQEDVVAAKVHNLNAKGRVWFEAESSGPIVGIAELLLDIQFRKKLYSARRLEEPTAEFENLPAVAPMLKDVVDLYKLYEERVHVVELVRQRDSKKVADEKYQAWLDALALNRASIVLDKLNLYGIPFGKLAVKVVDDSKASFSVVFHTSSKEAEEDVLLSLETGASRRASDPQLHASSPRMKSQFMTAADLQARAADAVVGTVFEEEVTRRAVQRASDEALDFRDVGQLQLLVQHAETAGLREEQLNAARQVLEQASAEMDARRRSVGIDTQTAAAATSRLRSQRCESVQEEDEVEEAERRLDDERALERARLRERLAGRAIWEGLEAAARLRDAEHLSSALRFASDLGDGAAMLGADGLDESSEHADFLPNLPRLMDDISRRLRASQSVDFVGRLVAALHGEVAARVPAVDQLRDLRVFLRSEEVSLRVRRLVDECGACCRKAAAGQLPLQKLAIVSQSLGQILAEADGLFQLPALQAALLIAGVLRPMVSGDSQGLREATQKAVTSGLPLDGPIGDILAAGRSRILQLQRLKAVRAALKAALASGRLEFLRLAVADAEHAGLEPADISAPKEVLLREEAKAAARLALDAACRDCHEEDLESALEQGIRVGLSKEELAYVETLLEQVRELTMQAEEWGAAAGGGGGGGPNALHGSSLEQAALQPMQRRTTPEARSSRQPRSRTPSRSPSPARRCGHKGAGSVGVEAWGQQLRQAISQGVAAGLPRDAGELATAAAQLAAEEDARRRQLFGEPLCADPGLVGLPEEVGLDSGDDGVVEDKGEDEIALDLEPSQLKQQYKWRGPTQRRYDARHARMHPRMQYQLARSRQRQRPYSAGASGAAERQHMLLGDPEERPLSGKSDRYTPREPKEGRELQQAPTTEHNFTELEAHTASGRELNFRAPPEICEALAKVLAPNPWPVGAPAPAPPAMRPASAPQQRRGPRAPAGRPQSRPSSAASRPSSAASKAASSSRPTSAGRHRPARPSSATGASGGLTVEAASALTPQKPSSAPQKRGPAAQQYFRPLKVSDLVSYGADAKILGKAAGVLASQPAAAVAAGAGARAALTARLQRQRLPPGKLHAQPPPSSASAAFSLSPAEWRNPAFDDIFSQ
eukprot:TRINITY_DN40261_c0_g1_i1.p1 TRINITY_DN40261_c0_g1~~TRINITY_DN40261_c0_g1_i1.p1  ORF type:complete len:1117 (-),score=339.74 TRINITY_DN40261_c0_g1_i1:344-3694(-)